MSNMEATEMLCELLDERCFEHETKACTDEGAAWSYDTKWRAKNGVLWCFTEFADGHTVLSMLGNLHDCTPDQAVAATLYSLEYESKMDALLSRLTNGKFSKTRNYPLSFMESCVNEEFEALYAKEQSDREAELIKAINDVLLYAKDVVWVGNGSETLVDRMVSLGVYGYDVYEGARPWEVER